MPVVSAVLTLPAEPHHQTIVLSQLRAMEGVLVGPIQAEQRLPIVLDSSDRATDKALWNAVSTLPGVVHIELVSADFSDLDRRSLGGRSAHSRRTSRAPHLHAVSNP